ncbi:MAG: HAMP domain-containing histidine kinase [Ramlibacter sp.]|nr:HAMP domain-containing histidine kinase [Ramlibacter sp.]
MEANALPGPQELYDAVPCGLMLAASSGSLLKVNRTICKWLGHGEAALLGMRLHDLLTVGSRIFYQTHLAPLLRMQGSVAEVKLELRRADGVALPVMVNLSETAGATELFVNVAVFLAADRLKYERELLLQRRRAEELASQYAQAQSDLAIARAQAEDRAQLAEQMVGVVSHDLRNPLAVINMGAAVLRMGKLPLAQANVVARIERATKRAERLIADLLDVTQARLAGGIGVKPVPVDVHEVVGESLNELSDAFTEHTIVHERAGPGIVEVDADRIVQAVGNLVANAVKYGAPGRPVTVTTDGSAAAFTIRVHNQGPPIPTQLASSLFEPMVRGAEKVEGAQGVGLGLFIVREIAKAHGGTVLLSSSDGNGTIFTITLRAGE